MCSYINVPVSLCLYMFMCGSYVGTGIYMCVCACLYSVRCPVETFGRSNPSQTPRLPSPTKGKGVSTFEE